MCRYWSTSLPDGRNAVNILDFQKSKCRREAIYMVTFYEFSSAGVLIVTYID